MKESFGDVITENNRRYDFAAVLKKHNLVLYPTSLETLWVNVTRRCNQACTHCHVDASPDRTEQMRPSIIEHCLDVLANNELCNNLDITGGAPELHPQFEYFVVEARKLGKHVIVRHNLTVTIDGDPSTGSNKEHLPHFFAENKVEVLASLPHYTQDLTDNIRGVGVFRKSIDSLRRLNEVGYGLPETGLILNIVYNVDGQISPVQRYEVEERFRQELLNGYGLVFNRLFSVTNMPICRFKDRLQQTGGYTDYMDKLAAAFNPLAAEQVVCRSLVSVGYDGHLYDCDFNQMLNMQILVSEPLSVSTFNMDTLLRRKIKFGVHCFGCTAGGGSS